MQLVDAASQLDAVRSCQGASEFRCLLHGLLYLAFCSLERPSVVMAGSGTPQPGAAAAYDEVVRSQAADLSGLFLVLMS